MNVSSSRCRFSMVEGGVIAHLEDLLDCPSSPLEAGGVLEGVGLGGGIRQDGD